VDTLVALGSFTFTALWCIVFLGLCDVVRGASLNATKLNADEDRAAAEMLSTDHKGLSKRDHYMRVKLATAHLLGGDRDGTRKTKPKRRTRLTSSRVDHMKDSQKTLDDNSIILHVRRIGMDGWDAERDYEARKAKSEDIVGTWEKEEKLREVFRPYVTAERDVMHVAIRHRVENTSWAEITMDADGALKALNALQGHEVLAGESKLLLEEEAKGGQLLAETEKLRAILDRRALEAKALIKLDEIQKLGPQRGRLQSERLEKTVSKRALKLGTLKAVTKALHQEELDDDDADEETAGTKQVERTTAQLRAEVEALSTELRDIEELRNHLHTRAQMMDDFGECYYPKADSQKRWGCSRYWLLAKIENLAQKIKERSYTLALRNDFRDTSHKQLNMLGLAAGVCKVRIQEALKGSTPTESIMVLIKAAEKLRAEQSNTGIIEAEKWLAASRLLLAQKQCALDVDPVDALQADRAAATIGARAAQAVRDTNAQVRQIAATRGIELKVAVDVKANGHEASVEVAQDAADAADAAAVPIEELAIRQIDEWLTIMVDARESGGNGAPSADTVKKGGGGGKERYTIRVWGIGREVNSGGVMDPRVPGKYENEEAVRGIFEQFGDCIDVTVHHRVQNTSWALVTLREVQAGRTALRAAEAGLVKTGDTALTVSKFNKKKARNSKGGMQNVSIATAKAVRNVKTAQLVVGETSDDARSEYAAAVAAAEDQLDAAYYDFLEECVEQTLMRLHQKKTGGANVAAAEEQHEMLVVAFADADVDDNGSMDHDEVCALAESLGIRLCERDHRSLQSLQGDDGDGMIDFDMFEQWWKQFSGGGTGGAFTRLMFAGGMDLERVKLSDRHLRTLERHKWVCVVLAACLLVCVAYMCVAATHIIDGRVDTEPGVLETLLFPSRDCAGLSSTALALYGWSILLLWAPAAVVASLVWPTWLLSLQVGAALAADNVEDVLAVLQPRMVPVWAEAGKAADGTPQLLNKLWQEQVALPASMLVGTMHELNAWGPEMGLSLLGCVTTSLCLLPAAAALDATAFMLVTVLVTALPLFQVVAPARVSSSCEKLYEGLTEIAFVGDVHHKQRCAELKRGLADINIRQGLGFLIFRKVINNLLLVKLAATLLSGLVTFGIGLLQLNGDSLLDALYNTSDVAAAAAAAAAANPSEEAAVSG
jgi:hypothetical protein